MVHPSPGVASASSARAAPRRPRGTLAWLGVAVLAVVLTVLLRAFVVESFVIPSESMQPGLEPGDRVLVNKLPTRGPLSRGDVVVFDGALTFGPSQGVVDSEGGLLTRLARGVGGRDGAATYVKRVIGIGGDRVACCATSGQLTVNGAALPEPYLYAGDGASDLRFDIVVPAGRLWLMGDHRSASGDSRAHLGGPGGGTVAEGDVIGPVMLRVWPWDRLGRLPGAASQLERADSNGERRGPR